MFFSCQNIRLDDQNPNAVKMGGVGGGGGVSSADHTILIFYMYRGGIQSR